MLSTRVSTPSGRWDLPDSVFRIQHWDLPGISTTKVCLAAIPESTSITAALSAMTDGLINFGGLEALIHGVVDGQKELAAQVQRIETTLATFASKDELNESTTTTAETMAKVERQLERIDVQHRAGQHIIEEVPEMRRELTTRMTELEQRLTTDVSNATLSLGGRVNACENDLRNRASLAELRKMAADIEERVKREEVRGLQDLVNKVRDEASSRIDDIGERTFSMRKELDERLTALSQASETMERSVTDRTRRLEEQSAQVSSFLVKSERAINTKVASPPALALRVPYSFLVQLFPTPASHTVRVFGVQE